MLTQAVVDFISRYENGSCSEQEVIEGMQLLINTGVVWCLQGSYQRLAAQLIESGQCTIAKSDNPDCTGGQCSLD